MEVGGNLKIVNKICEETGKIASKDEKTKVCVRFVFKSVRSSCFIRVTWAVC